MRAIGMIVLGVVAACGGSTSRQQTTPETVPAGPMQAAPTTPPEPGETPAPAAKSLYERLGGQSAITAVVDEFVNRTTTDPRLAERFFNTDPTQLKQLLVEFVCVATGGPCKYTGRDMVTSHGGMEVVDEEFTALVEILAAVLDKFEVPEQEKSELLGALGPLKPQIVTPADKLKPIDGKKLAQVRKLQAKLEDKKAAELLGLAVEAGKRGQRNYAELLFTRAEMIVGPKPLGAAARVFREGAPVRITTKTKVIDDKAPQPEVDTSEEEEPAPPPKAKVGSLAGHLTIDGKAPRGFGVIMLTPVKGPYKKRTPKHRIIEQRGKEFAPHVMAVPVGSTVSFPNFDSIYHNVFSLSKSKSFDLGMYKSGETREMKFDKPGIVRLGCNLHAAMSAYLIVVGAPHYALVKKDGKFSFRALKPGKYKVQVWNEYAGDPMTAEVEIGVGENTKDFELKASPPGVSPDKFGTSRG